MAMATRVERVKQLWENWDIRILMLTSLLIQSLLTLLAPNRKRSSNGFLKILLWILYLSADAIALFTIGLIASSGDNEPRGAILQNPDVLSFWAPFLLLHLGGPDTITAFALEDNELWRRHALQFVTQVVVTLYVFGRSLHRSSALAAPTVLMFIDGSIKYFERTCALYYASMDSFRDSQRIDPETGPNYARLMEEYSCATGSSIPAKFHGQGGVDPSDFANEDRVDPCDFDNEQSKRTEFFPICVDLQADDDPVNSWYLVKENNQGRMIQADAYQWYDMFKGLLADSFLSLKERNESRESFLRKTVDEAFGIVEIELNFMYDVFYTKAFLFQKRRRYARLLCFLSVTVSLILFWLQDKSKYREIDVGITYALLGGAITLDVIATILFLFSDWCVVLFSDGGGRSTPKRLAKSLHRRSRKIVSSRRRWSQTISKYSLLQHCLKDPPSLSNHGFIAWIMEQLNDVLIECFCVEKIQIGRQLGDFIAEELRKKAWLANDLESAKEVCSARGNLVFLDDYLLVSEYLRQWTLDVDYDESLLTWHLATDICYWTSTNSNNDDELKHRKLSKDLSDYMSYLFLRQKGLVSPVLGISDDRFRDTCAEANTFIRKRFRLSWWLSDACWKAKKCVTSNSREKDDKRRQREEQILEQCCAKILEMKAEVRPIVAKGDKSKSVFFDACRLARQLKGLGGSQWEITAKVWVELLCYAAVRCTSRSHLAELTNGGQLITLVWLLMAHLGLGERFRKTQGFGWTKLIIPK